MCLTKPVSSTISEGSEGQMPHLRPNSPNISPEVLSANDTKANLPPCPLANDQMQSHDPTTMRQAHPGSQNSPACRTSQDLPRCFGTRVWLDQTNKPGGHTHTHIPNGPKKMCFWGVRWFTTRAENEGNIQHGLLISMEPRQVGVRTIGFQNLGKACFYLLKRIDNPWVHDLKRGSFS